MYPVCRNTLISDFRILLLDEATSALDAESEYSIWFRRKRLIRWSSGVPSSSCGASVIDHSTALALQIKNTNGKFRF